MVAQRINGSPANEPKLLPFAQMGFPEGIEYFHQGVEVLNIQASIENMSGVPFGPALPDWKIQFAPEGGSWQLKGEQDAILSGTFEQDLLQKRSVGNVELAVACGAPILRAVDAEDPRTLQIFIRDTDTNVALHLFFHQEGGSLAPQVGVSASVHAMMKGYAALPPNFDAEMFIRNVHSGYVVDAELEE